MISVCAMFALAEANPEDFSISTNPYGVSPSNGATAAASLAKIECEKANCGGTPRGSPPPLPPSPERVAKANADACEAAMET